MPRRNIFIIAAVCALAFFLTSRFSLTDRILITVLNTVDQKALEQTDRTDLIQGALDGIMRRSPYYPYTAYLPPGDESVYQDEMQGVFAGIGIGSLAIDTETRELWFTPIYGGPAWKKGLRLGDRIIQVNGTPLSECSFDEILGLFRGAEGTPVQLTIRPHKSILNTYRETPLETEELKELEILRGAVHQDIVCGYRRQENGEWEYTLDDHPEIGCIRIDQFTDDTGPLFKKALETLKAKGTIKALILDLRGNPGGFIEGAVQVASPFLPEGAEIVTTQDRNGKIRARLTAEKSDKIDWKLAVLIDGESASAAEIAAGALADHHRAFIAGTRSYGKGTVQELFSLPCNMGLIRLTDASWNRPNGAPIQRPKDALETDNWGITPDPELTIPLDSRQKTAVLLLRDLRASGPIPEEDREPMNRLILARSEQADLSADFEDGGKEPAEESDSPEPILPELLLTDPQLEKAAEALLKELVH